MTKSIPSTLQLISLGHLAADINQGALSAILPFLITLNHYDYTTTASLVMLYSLTGSVVQPLFGQLADKYFTPCILPFSLLLACGGMAFTGLTTNYYLLCLSVIVSGIGVAMFHPTAALIVNKLIPRDCLGRALSIFAFGGNMGFCLGPVLCTASLSYLGMQGTLFMLLPALIFLGMFTKQNGKLNEAPVPSSAKKSSASPAKDDWPSFRRVCGVVIGRSIVLYGLNTFLVLYWIYALQQTKALGSSMLSLFFIFGSISTILGGHLADKIGCRRVILLSFLLLFPSLMLFSTAPNIYISTALLLPMGVGVNLCYSSFVVLGQQYLPKHLGLASGVTLGLSVSLGGIATPLLGMLADTYGLLSIFYILSAFCLLPLWSAYTLPHKAEQSLKPLFNYSSLKNSYSNIILGFTTIFK